MQGKTHFAVGIACALAILKPQTMPMLIAGTGAAGIGAVISDIDVGSSSAHGKADQVMAAAIAMFAAVIIIDMNFHLGIYERILAGISRPERFSVLLIFISICAIGKSTKHRTFMHSFLVMFLLSLCVYFLFPELVWYFAVAFASHLMLDLLNRKKVRLFWPSKKGWCLSICNGSGRINRIILAAGTLGAAALFMNSVPMTGTMFRIQSFVYGLLP